MLADNAIYLVAEKKEIKDIIMFNLIKGMKFRRIDISNLIATEWISDLIFLNFIQLAGNACDMTDEGVNRFSVSN